MTIVLSKLRLITTIHSVLLSKLRPQDFLWSVVVGWWSGDCWSVEGLVCVVVAKGRWQ